MPGVLTISEFYLDNRISLRALVTWDPANPGDIVRANMLGQSPFGVDWTVRNGGIAFLNIFQGDGSSLRFETWGTDTNGNNSAAAIDIFTMPIDITGPFPQLNSTMQATTRHNVWTYVLCPIANNPNGFLLTAGQPVPPSNAKVLIKTP